MRRSCSIIGICAAVWIHQAVATDDADASCLAHEGSDARVGASLLQVATDRRAAGALRTPDPQPTALFSSLKGSGAMLSSSLEVATFKHGGYDVRGVRTKVDLKKHAELLKIPKSMWIQGTLPAIMKGSHRPAACKDLEYEDTLGQVIQLHEEGRKGRESKFYEYLKTLPSLEDYQSFYPSFADDELLHDFRGLHFIVDSVNEDRQRFETFYECIQALKPHVPSLSDISLNETLRLQAASYTRTFSLGKDKSTFMPIADLWNTANDDGCNMDWDLGAGVFQLKARRPLKAGDELFDPYCQDCANDAMLVTWGVMLADNPNPLTTSASCSKLKAPTMAALGLRKGSALPALADAECHTTDVKRCSFAKLALEHCEEKWSGTAKTSLVQKASVGTARFQKSALRARQALRKRLAIGGGIESAGRSA